MTGMICDKCGVGIEDCSERPDLGPCWHGVEDGSALCPATEPDPARHGLDSPDPYWAHRPAADGGEA